MIVSRFAPSPSGRLHVGNIFSFMVAALYAKQQGGSMVMRMEDLDPQRSKQEFADQILRDMEWFGFEWEGPVLYQSSRTEAYAQGFDELADKGLVYPCFCTRADLHSARAPHRGEEVVYVGTCRTLTSEEREVRSASRHPSQRLEVGSALEGFQDLFQGEREYRLSEVCGDFIIQRSDGVYAYQLAVVLDDAFQGVTHVIRGCDLLTSTPRQRYISNLLGLPEIEYGHVALITDETGTRLSKRNGDASLEFLIDQAKLTPGQILGHLAALAGLIETYEPLSLDELARSANLQAVQGVEEVVWQPFNH